MNLWIVESGKLVSYVREGECSRCAECCCTHEISFRLAISNTNNDSSDSGPECADDDWSEWEGWSAIYWHGFWVWAKCETTDKLLEHPCPSLEGNRCLHWDLDSFPGICRIWPVHPDNLHGFPKCGFRFVRRAS